MKNIKKIISLILLSALLLTAISCAKDAAGDDELTRATETTGGTGEETDPAESLGLPPELDYKNAKVTIIIDAGQAKQNRIFEETGEPVDDAIYRRQRLVEELLGVEIEWIERAAGWNDRAPFHAFVTSDVMAGSGGFDLMAVYNLIPPMLASSGLLIDMNELEYLDPQKPWWPQAYIEQAAYDDKLYFLAESSGKGVIRNMMGIFFDKDMLEDHKLENPYEIVEDGRWTLDKLDEMTKGVYYDVNGNNLKDAGDRFGLSTATAPYLDSYFYAAGLTLTQTNPNGDPYFDLDNEKVYNYITRMCDLLHNREDILSVDSAQYLMFKERRALFYHTAIAIGDQLRSVEGINYGLVPMPKWDDSQVSYHTALSNTHDVWAITKSAENPQMSGAVLEAMSYYAHQEIGPALFELTYKIKYASDPIINGSYDKLRDGIMFDFAYVYSLAFESIRMPMLHIRDCVANNNTNWASVWASLKDPYDKQMKTVLDSLAKG